MTTGEMALGDFATRDEDETTANPCIYVGTKRFNSFESSHHPCDKRTSMGEITVSELDSQSSRFVSWRCTSNYLYLTDWKPRNVHCYTSGLTETRYRRSLDLLSLRRSQIESVEPTQLRSAPQEDSHFRADPAAAFAEIDIRLCPLTLFVSLNLA